MVSRNPHTREKVLQKDKRLRLKRHELSAYAQAREASKGPSIQFTK